MANSLKLSAQLASIDSLAEIVVDEHQSPYSKLHLGPRLVRSNFQCTLAIEVSCSSATGFPGFHHEFDYDVICSNP